MMTKYIYKALSIEKPKDKKFLLVFQKETRFDIKYTDNKITKDKGFLETFNSLAIRSGSLKSSKPKLGFTRFLSSSPN